MLSPGARIAVVAPSGIFDPDRLRQSCALISDWGYEPVEGRHIHESFRYTAGSAAHRTADLRWALTAPDIDGVWFARGGYGTVHTLADLPWDQIDDRPVIGFSDATALFCGMWARQRGTAIHGPVLHSLADHVDPESRQWLRDLLAGRTLSTLPVRQISGPATTVQGRLVGGNLCVMASLAGSRWLRPSPGGVLLLEDLHEPPYKLDRMITQLHLAGVLEGLSAVVLGEFIRCEPKAESGWSLSELFADLFAPLGIPVFADLAIGHGARNRAMVLGGMVRVGQEGLDVVRD